MCIVLTRCGQQQGHQPDNRDDRGATSLFLYSLDRVYYRGHQAPERGGEGPREQRGGERPDYGDARNKHNTQEHSKKSEEVADDRGACEWSGVFMWKSRLMNSCLVG